MDPDSNFNSKWSKDQDLWDLSGNRDGNILSISSSNQPMGENIRTSSGITQTLRNTIRSRKIPLSGIVYKMDDIAERALIRVEIAQYKCKMASSQYKPIDISHLYIPYYSIGKCADIELGSRVQILDYDGLEVFPGIGRADKFADEEPAEIITYSVIQDPESTQLVALISYHHNYLKVLGSFRYDEVEVAFPRNANRFEWRNLVEHTFLYGNLIELPECYALIVNEEVPELIFEHQRRLESIRSKMPLACNNLLTKIRQLTNLEIKTIKQQTRNLEQIDYKLAEQYVLDPLLTCAALENFVSRNSEKQFTCEVSDLFFEVLDTFVPPKYVIYVPRSPQVQHCLRHRGKDTWHLGSDLLLFTNQFIGGSIPVVLESTDAVYNGAMHICLVGGAGFEQVLESLSKHQDKKNWSNVKFHLGPHCWGSNKSPQDLRHLFKQFYADRFSLFEAFVGRAAAPDRANIPEIDEEDRRGRKLDDSQKEAVRTALGVPGFTCVSAPPGSGKTFLISEIILSKVHKDPYARFGLCGATNTAVTNAVEIVNSKLLPGNCIRQFSPRAEAELDKHAEVLSLSLRRMIENKNKVASLMNYSDEFDKAATNYSEAKLIIQKKIGSVSDQSVAVSEFKKAEFLLGVLFVKYYAPTVFGTTAFIMASASHKEMTHLIIDEASQLSQIDALYLYCRLPDLKFITLIGDSRQLGPFVDINRGTLAYEIMQKGELYRLQQLKSPAKVKLQYIYRSHPRIIDLLLKPIYGPQLKSGTPYTDRNLAEEKGLPRASDNSPVLFVQVDGVEERRRNRREAEVVLDFLKQLNQKGIQSEDVSIICHHKAQKDILCQALKDRGTVGLLNLNYNVNTVDSYQGREAKVVLILTTKTCGSSDPEIIKRTFSFVSDPQRETVAVSRSQHAIYIFGNWRQLSAMPFWKKFGEGIVRSGAIVNEHWQPIHHVWKLDESQKRNLGLF